ncbi:hypothetical protein F5Y10DRAFT_268775 [Nemania abortiva]|nr:hypothetical protein F5Y10DRAFT_268775 [Nemania abortiva]
MKTASLNAPCQHSDGKGMPECWNCAEEGHIKSTSSAKGGGVAPTWQKLGILRRSFGFVDGTLSRTGAQVSDLEVRLPEEGLEVSTPYSRQSQPGLEVVEGPRVVNFEEKLRKPELNSLSLESIHKVDVASNAESNLEPAAVLKSIKTVWGVRRRTFSILVVIAILALVGLVIGVAVGVTQQKGAYSTSLEVSGGGQVSSGSPSIRPTTTTKTLSFYAAAADSSTTFRTLPETGRPSSTHQVGSVQASSGTTTAAGEGGRGNPEPAAVPTSAVSGVSPQTATTPMSHSPTPSPSSRDCLGDDGSIFTDHGTGDRFKIECDVAHQGRDLENIEAQTMEDCVSLCAKNNYCKGAIWYNVGPQGTDLNYCWLKSDMDDDIRVTPDAQSVVRL